jgi:hypothetical protein
VAVAEAITQVVAEAQVVVAGVALVAALAILEVPVPTLVLSVVVIQAVEVPVPTGDSRQ